MKLVIGLLAIIAAIFAYLYFTKDATAPVVQDQQGNGNVSEPPPPAPAPNPSPAQQPEPAFEQNWLLDKLVLGGKAVDMNVNVPQALTLNFDSGIEGNYSGFAGCNGFSGTYSRSGSDGFSFGATASTKMYCMESSALESKIFEAMGDVSKYQVQSGNLIFSSADGQTKIQYKPAI
jgi:heat shock protein HslJ